LHGLDGGDSDGAGLGGVGHGVGLLCGLMDGALIDGRVVRANCRCARVPPPPGDFMIPSVYLCKQQSSTGNR
jgi:hypothetical protein